LKIIAVKFFHLQHYRIKKDALRNYSSHLKIVFCDLFQISLLLMHKSISINHGFVVINIDNIK